MTDLMFADKIALDTIMSDEPVNVQALALNEQLNVGHIAALAKHYGVYIKKDLSTDVDNLKMFEARCSGHNMDSVPGDLNPQLRRLDLSYNRFTYSSDMAGYPDLEDLKLAYNQIAVLGDNCFIDNHEIVSLVLNHNKLDTLKVNDPAGLVSLVSLDLSNIKIDCFEYSKNVQLDVHSESYCYKELVDYSTSNTHLTTFPV